MNAIDVFRNGIKVCTAALQDGKVTVQLVVSSNSDPHWLNVRGQDRKTGGHVDWAHISVDVGDEFMMKLVAVSDE